MINIVDAPGLLEKLEQLGRRLGVVIRYELLGEDEDLAQTKSGLCRLKENRVLLVDSRLGPIDRCRVIIAEIKQLEIGSVYIPPVVRQLLEEPESDSNSAAGLVDRDNELD